MPNNALMSQWTIVLIATEQWLHLNSGTSAFSSVLSSPLTCSKCHAFVCFDGWMQWHSYRLGGEGSPPPQLHPGIEKVYIFLCGILMWNTYIEWKLRFQNSWPPHWRFPPWKITELHHWMDQSLTSLLHNLERVKINMTQLLLMVMNRGGSRIFWKEGREIMGAILLPKIAGGGAIDGFYT